MKNLSYGLLLRDCSGFLVNESLVIQLTEVVLKYFIVIHTAKGTFLMCKA